MLHVSLTRTGYDSPAMIDKFTIFLPHLLMALMVWRLLRRDDLDHDPVIEAGHEAAIVPKRVRRRHKPEA